MDIRDKVRVLDTQYAANTRVLKELKKQFKLNDLTARKVSYQTIMRTLVKYNAAPMLEGTWLTDLSNLVGNAGQETISTALVEIQHDPRYHDVLTHMEEVSRKLDIAESRYRNIHPQRRGAAYAAELSLAEEVSESPVVTTSSKKRKRASTTQQSPTKPSNPKFRPSCDGVRCVFYQVIRAISVTTSTLPPKYRGLRFGAAGVYCGTVIRRCPTCETPPPYSSEHHGNGGHAAFPPEPLRS